MAILSFIAGATDRLGTGPCGPTALRAQDAGSDGLRVEVRVSSGAHHVGEGLELRAGVLGAGRRPEIEPPTIADADVWLIRRDLSPVSVSGIGGVMGESNVFISRYRAVPRRAGTLEIPSIRARLGDQVGRSRPLRLTIRPLPPEGRPASFLGGVGAFALRAEASPRSVRVGQELEYRITVEGPAAWGMTGRPDLERLDRLDLGLRIEPRSAELTREPPSRTFAYRLRPTRPGEAVLPGVAISAFDPASGRYLTRVTPSVPIRSVAVPSFDTARIPDLGTSTERDARRLAAIRWGAMIVAAGLLAASAGAIAWVRRRARLAGEFGGPAAARRFAARTARGLAHGAPYNTRQVAQQVDSALTRYLRLAIGRPPGAITPDEAREGVARCTGSETAGAQAARLVVLCDGVLYRDAPAPPGDSGELHEEARRLFTRLGGRS